MTTMHVLNVHYDSGDVERAIINTELSSWKSRVVNAAPRMYHDQQTDEAKKSLLKDKGFCDAMFKRHVRLLRADYARLSLDQIQRRSPELVFPEQYQHG